MNTTTFTIESVHGIKQTFELGPTIRVATGNQTQETSGSSDASQSSVKTKSSAARQ
jgi:hypothetical protein